MTNLLNPFRFSSGYDILFVGAGTTANTGQQEFIDRLGADGHNVTYRDVDDPELTSGYDIVILDSNLTGDPKYYGNNMPVINGDITSCDNYLPGMIQENTGVDTAESSVFYKEDDAISWTNETAGTTVTVSSQTANINTADFDRIPRDAQVLLMASSNDPFAWVLPTGAQTRFGHERITFQGSSSNSGIGDVTVSWPTHVADDVAFLFVESATGESVSLGTPAGFTEIGFDETADTGGEGTRLTVFWCRATTASQASPVITDPGDHAYGVMVTYRGCATTGDPWWHWDFITNDTASTTGNAPTLYHMFSEHESVYCVTHGRDSAGAWGSSPGASNLLGEVERFDNGVTDGNGGGIYIYDGYKTDPGAVGTNTVTDTGSSPHTGFGLIMKPVYWTTPYPYVFLDFPSGWYSDGNTDTTKHDQLFSDIMDAVINDTVTVTLPDLGGGTSRDIGLVVDGLEADGSPTDDVKKHFWADLQRELGHTVTCIDDGAAEVTTGHDLIIVAGGTSLVTLSKYQGKNLPVLRMDADDYDAADLTQAQGTLLSNVHQWELMANSDGISYPLLSVGDSEYMCGSAGFQVYELDPTTELLSDADSWFCVDGDTTKIIAFTLASGSTLDDSSTTSAKVVCMALASDFNINRFNGPGLQMIEEAIQWLAV